MLKHDYHLLRVVVSYKSQLPWPFQFWAQDPPETMGKGSGMKMPLLVAGIFSKLRGSAGHSVPHCCGKQSQGCNQKSSGCDVLGSSKTKGCRASCRSTMSGCKFNKVTSTSRVFEISSASKIQDTHGVHTLNTCVIYWVYMYTVYHYTVARLSHRSWRHPTWDKSPVVYEHNGHALFADWQTFLHVESSCQSIGHSETNDSFGKQVFLNQTIFPRLLWSNILYICIYLNMSIYMFIYIYI